MPFQTSSNGSTGSSSGGATQSEMLAIGLGASVSTLNATTTPLAGGTTFTGTGELVLQPDAMMVVQTDAPGTLFADFSIDGGSNYSSFPVNGFDVAAGINEFHTAVKGPRTFRVRLVNGASAQSYLRVAVYYDSFGSPNAPLNQTIGADADAIIVRSVNSDLDLQRGTFSGLATGNKFGYSPSLGTGVTLATPATWVDMWVYGGQRTSPTGSFTPFMASDDASDTNIDIKWTYHDANGEEQTVTVATDASDGRTPVSLGVTATEVYRGKNMSSTELSGGVGCTSANNFTNGSPDNQNEVLAFIPVNHGQTQILAGRVPSNKSYLLQSLDVHLTRSSGSPGSALLSFQAREPGETFVTKRPIGVSDPSSRILDLRGLTLPGGTDYRLRIRDVSDNDTTLDGNLEFYSVDT